MKAKGLILAMSIATLSGAGACARTFRPFVRTDGSATNGGVTVALSGQRCGRRNWVKTMTVLDLRLAVLVSNRSATSVTVAPRQFLLLARGDATPPEDDPPSQTLPPGASLPIQLHFRYVGLAQCNEQLFLSLDHTVEMRGHSLSLRPLPFVPESSDT
jgi:hypothetical protein